RAQVIALCAAYRVADDQPSAEREVQCAVDDALRGDPLVLIYLIELGQARCAGYLAITIGYSIEVGGRDAFVDELYVEDWARGQGIGTRALAFAEGVCAELRVKRLCMEVEHENPRARRLYEKLGFVAHSRTTLSKRLA
ncbi:MAG: GNAT family N-acetyltransferase, partial [Polyangiales bacterium]